MNVVIKITGVDEIAQDTQYSYVGLMNKGIRGRN